MLDKIATHWSLGVTLSKSFLNGFPSNFCLDVSMSLYPLREIILIPSLYTHELNSKLL